MFLSIFELLDLILGNPNPRRHLVSEQRYSHIALVFMRLCNCSKISLVWDLDKRETSFVLILVVNKNVFKNEFKSVFTKGVN